LEFWKLYYKIDLTGDLDTMANCFQQLFITDWDFPVKANIIPITDRKEIFNEKKI